MNIKNLKRFTDLPQVNEKIQNIQKGIAEIQREYEDKLSNEPYDFIGLKKIDRRIWISKICIHNSLRHCLANLSVLNDIQFEIVFTAIEEHLKNRTFINFEMINKVINNEMRDLKVGYEIDKETHDLFRNNILDL